jgi:hypothetical protein
MKDLMRKFDAFETVPCSATTAKVRKWRMSIAMTIPKKHEV